MRRCMPSPRLCRLISRVHGNERHISVVGLLSAVGSLEIYSNASHDTYFLTWTPPFTLDITGVDPDITGYCVDVTSHSNSTPTLHSQCGINVTEFNFDLSPDSGCHRYIATVKPVNVLGNGSLSSVELPQECEHEEITVFVFVVVVVVAFSCDIILVGHAPRATNYSSIDAAACLT